MAGRFGTQLQSLLHQLGVKNAVLARAPLTRVIVGL